MGKVLLVLSFIALMILAIGTAKSPQDPAFWLASGAAGYQHVRELLMSVLFLQAVTRPPRHVIFRILSGGIGLFTAVWVVSATYSYQMPFLDTFCFMAAAIAIAVTALERRVVIGGRSLVLHEQV